MEFRQVRYFLALCEYGNFTHAAAACNVSQPSLTQSIRKLEEELGGALFTRCRSGCGLTPLGRILQPRLEAARRELQEAEAAAARHVRLKQVPIRLGLMETVGPERIGPALATYQARHPEIEFEVIAGSQDFCLDHLRDGWFDLALGPGNVAPEDLFQAESLYEEPYVVVFLRGHRFEAKEAVDIADLRGETLLDRPNCEMRDRLMEFCIGEGIELYAPYRTSDIATMKRLIRDGVGVAILPCYSVRDADAGLAVRPLSRPGLAREIGAIRARSQPVRPQTTALVRTLQTHGCRSPRAQDAAE